MGYRYKVVNRSGEILTLASKQNNQLIEKAISGGVWELAPWKPRLREAELFTRPGVVISGDEQPSKRIIPITWRSSAVNEAKSFEEMNYIARFFRPDLGEFFVIDTKRNIRFRTRLDSYQPKSIANGDVRAIEHKLKLLMLDSSVEDEDEVTEEDGSPIVRPFAESDDGIVLENKGSLNSYPRFEIYRDPDSAVISPIESFSFTNESNNTGLFWSFTVQTNQELVLDSGGNGDVSVDGVDRSAGIRTGGLISLRPGSNTLQITDFGVSGWRMRIKYRGVYAF